MLIGRRILGLAAILAGAVGLAFSRFAWTGEAANAHGLVRELLTYGANALLIAGGIGINLGRRLAAPSAVLLAAVLAVGTVALQWAVLLRRWSVWGAWENLAEALAMITGALIAWTLVREGRGAGAAQLAVAARRLFGACLVVFGISHFVYLNLTAPLVPAWLPLSKVLWAYATGLAQIAAGFALISGFAARLAAVLLTAMYVLFALLVWIPAVREAPHALGNWTENGINLLLVGAAWCVADSLARRGKA